MSLPFIKHFTFINLWFNNIYSVTIFRFLGSMLFISYICTDRSRAEKLWLVCGVMGDVMLCDRERDIHPSQKFYAIIHSEKMIYLTILLFCKH
jgi:hypothetical protein